MYRHGDRRIISIVLTGQPYLDDILDAPGLIQLRQRARLRQRLEALNEEETVAYLRHRLAIAGGDLDKIFEPDAVKDIHRLTQGIPRLINTLLRHGADCLHARKPPQGDSGNHR